MDGSILDPSLREIWDSTSRPAAGNAPVRGGLTGTTINKSGHSHGGTEALGALIHSNGTSVSADHVSSQPSQATSGATGIAHEDTRAGRPSAGRTVDGDFFLSNISASLRSLQQRRARSTGRQSSNSGQGADQRLLAPQAVDGSSRVPVRNLVHEILTVDRGPVDEQPTPAPTGKMPWENTTPLQTQKRTRMQIPVSTAPTQTGTTGRRAMSEDDVDDRLRHVAQQVQDRIEIDQEDSRLQHMLLIQQRVKRVKTGLDELSGVLRECRGNVDALSPDTGRGQPIRVNREKRFLVPRIEMAPQQTYAVRNTFLTSRAITDENSDKRQSRGAGLIAVASENAVGLPGFGEDELDTTSLGTSVHPKGFAPRSGAQPPLKNIRLLLWLPPLDNGNNNTMSTDKIPAYGLEDFTYACCPEYIALSYVWGEESVVSTISVNGATVPIRTNLAQALASIRVSDPVAYVWADAICINQQDDQEKSILVQHMGEIFANAKLVYAWLGPIERVSRGCSTGDLFAQLRELGALFWKHAGPADSGHLNECRLDLDSILEKNLPALFSRFAPHHPGQPGGFPTEEYASFSARPFWSRIWVLQEVFLAKRLYYICGHCRLESKDLAGALILLESFQAHLIRSQSIARERIASNSLLGKFAFDFPSFPEMHRLIIYTSIYPSDVVSLRIAMTNFCVKELPRGSRATDPRDMIYGLMGFANDEERSYIRADYSKSVQETYATVMRSLIRNGFTDILAWAQPRTKRIAHLPSWVPDYSSTIYESLCSQGQAKPWLPQFKACGDTRYSDNNAPLFDDLTLPVHGRRLGGVLWAGRLWFPRSSAGGAPSCTDDAQTSLSRSASYEELLFYLREIKDLVSHAKKIHGRNTTTRQGDGVRTIRSVSGAAWRVPCCDQIVLHSRLVRGDPSAERRYKATLSGLEACIRGPESELPAESRPYIEALLRWADKRPFLTIDGFIGLGPAGIERGDIVAVLDGFNACYILRSQNLVERREYHLVGEAYVDGVMDGEMAYPTPDSREWFNLA
ncbi:heterokaryon incompatibility protein-domain-containing protein [Nemania abortiva]|nr:heterokaryon incompatibility protein-domain-containing protein [Nemania abortiva]